MHQRNSPRTTQHWSKSHVTRASRFCRDQCCNSMSHTKGKWLWSTRVQMMSRSSIKCCRTIGILRQREGNWEEQRDPCSLSLITSNDSRQCVCKTSSSIVLLPWRQTCQVTKWSILCFEQIDQWFTYKQHIKAVDFVVHGHFFELNNQCQERQSLTWKSTPWLQLFPWELRLERKRPRRPDASDSLSIEPACKR